MNTPRSDAIFKIGELLNNTFRIEAVLGRGGTSEVFRARNEISGRPVALKVLRAEYAGNEDFLVLMKREEQMRDIRHDAVVGYSEIHRTSGGHIYLVMDYVDGPSLETKLKQGGMPAQDILVVGRRVTEGLRAAHARNIVHRDLSPDNIVLRNGDPAQAVIIDFGIAKDTNPGAATIVGNEFAGKFSYAAPEQLAGKTDARSDIYALGATLLAAFHGKAPNLGSNLMDVVRLKGEKLDTADVPEPLKTVIDRMTAPAPEARFQSCQEILDFITTPAAPVTAADATVIRPIAAAAPKEKQERKSPAPDDKRPGAKSGTSPETTGGSKLPLIAGGVLLLAAAAGGGAWYAGLFGPGMPIADPYLLSVEKPEGGVPAAGGNVPSEEVLTALSGRVASGGGTANLSLATGEIADGWGKGVLEAYDAAAGLDSFRLDVTGNVIDLTGETSDADRRDAALGLFAPGAVPDGLSVQGRIDFGPAFLTAAMLQPVLSEMADCGPLGVADMPDTGLPRGVPVTVTGKLSSTAARIGLFDALAGVVGDREVNIDTEVLNPALCQVEQHLPHVPAGGIDIAYSFGKSGEENPSGRFFVGENPVIDLRLPADMTTGYLYSSIIDVTGSVFHLLPNVNRTGNSVEALRDGQTGEFTVRVAFPVAESTGPDKLAFLVDDSLLGKSKVIVLHTAEPLFDELRPTTESAEGYAAALEAVQQANAGAITSLDSRTISMVKP